MRHWRGRPAGARRNGHWMTVTPVPTDEEMAAIAAAVQALVLRPVILLTGNSDTVQPPAWRFSGRWWSRPVPVRRVRPWS